MTSMIEKYHCPSCNTLRILRSARSSMSARLMSPAVVGSVGGCCACSLLVLSWSSWLLPIKGCLQDGDEALAEAVGGGKNRRWHAGQDIPWRVILPFSPTRCLFQRPG